MKPGAHWWKLALAAGMLAIAADMAVPVSKATQFTFTPISLSMPITVWRVMTRSRLAVGTCVRSVDEPWNTPTSPTGSPG